MRAFACLLIFLATGAPGAGEAAVTVALRKGAVVGDGAVRLGDVAEITGEPASLVERVAAVDLGQAPQPGAPRVVSRRLLHVRLRQEHIDPGQVTWAGADAARVSRRCACVRGATIAQAAADELRQTLPWPDEDLVIEVRRPPADLHVLGSADDVRYTVALRPGQRLLGSVPVTITVTREGRAVGRATAVLGVRVFQRMLVARRRIRRGERLAKDMVRLQRGELTSATSDVATDLRQVLGAEARRDIPAFAAITDQMLAAPRVVRRGALVTLVASKGRLQVTTVGIAEQDGSVGQSIRVRNKDSQNIVHGRVLDAKTVEVPF
ncbi:MAG: flagellar basal body P-ring formation chaperone FlgA [Planctomycetota bacterium]